MFSTIEKNSTEARRRKKTSNATQNRLTNYTLDKNEKLHTKRGSLRYHIAEKKLTAASSICVIVLIYARIFKFDPKTYAWHDSRPNKVLIQFIHANATESINIYIYTLTQQSHSDFTGMTEKKLPE